MSTDEGNDVYAWKPCSGKRGAAAVVPWVITHTHRTAVMIIVVAAMLTALLLGGCGVGGDPLVGTWQGPLGVKAGFGPNGEFSIMGVTGRYKIKDRETVRLSAMGIIEDDKYEVDGDTLILTKPDGTMTQWARIKQE